MPLFYEPHNAEAISGPSVLTNPEAPEPVAPNVFRILNASLNRGFGVSEALRAPITPDNQSLETIIGAGFRQSNSLASMLGQVSGLPQYGQRPNLAFDRYAHIPEDKRMFSARYYNANSVAEVAAISQQLDQELANWETLAQSGWLGFSAAVAGGLLDPLNVLPLGGAFSKVKTGGSLLKGALTTAGVGLGAMTVSEAALQATQLTRTLDESATNIAAGTFLSGLLGGVGSAWGQALERTGARKLDALAQALEKDLTVPAVGQYTRQEAAQVLERYAQAESALKTLETQGVAKESADYVLTLSEYEARRAQWEQVAASVHESDFLSPGGVEVSAEALARDTRDVGGEASQTLDELLKDHGLLAKLPVLNQQDPLIRTLLSPSIETRRIVQQLAEVPLKYAKNALGVATEVPAEALIKQSKGPLAFALRKMDELFETYRYGEAGKLGKVRAEAQDLLGGPRQKLSAYEFKQAVGKAMRAGDVHEIPQVAEAARTFRKLVFDPLKNRAIRLGVLPEDVEPQTALSYLTRVWDVERIVAERPEFVRRNLEWLVQKEAATAQAAAEAGEAFTPRSREQLHDIADRLTDRILGTPGGRLQYEYLDLNPTATPDSIAGQAKVRAGRSTVGLARPLHRRLYDIPDQLVEDFLIHDVEQISKLYERTLGADLSLMETFGETDLDVLLESLRSRITKDYDIKLRQSETRAQRVRLEAKKREDLADIKGIFERLRGTYGLPADPNSTFVRAGRILRVGNYLSLMGGVTLSSIPDLARPMMVHGLQRYLKDGLIPLVTQFKTFRLAAEEIKMAGTACDMILDSRIMAMGELLDDYGRGNHLERGLSFLQHGFGQASGISQWTASMKQLAGMITQTRMIQAAVDTAAGKVSAKELENLAASYIDAEMARRIAKQFRQYGRTEGAVHLPNTLDWTDQEAVRTLRAALVKEVDRIIITPGQDKPLWLSTELGKLFGQFKSFAFASTQRVLLSGLQDRDLGTLNGLVFGVGLGIFATLLKAQASNRKISTRPEHLILEGIDRAGVTGWLFDANNMVEKATRGHFGLSPLVGKQPMSRYASRNLLDALIGPSAGRLQDTAQIAGSLSQAVAPREGEEGLAPWTESDTRALRRILPYQNLFYLRQLFDAAETNMQGILGIEAPEGEKTE